MGGGAWPFLVGGAVCLVDSDNERDSALLNSRSIDSLERCSRRTVRCFGLLRHALASAFVVRLDPLRVPLLAGGLPMGRCSYCLLRGISGGQPHEIEQ